LQFLTSATQQQMEARSKPRALTLISKSLSSPTPIG
jgi:hypothetical protein